MYLCKVKVLTAALLIIVQLALQIGVPIHTHFCDMDGVFTSVLLKIDHQCSEPHSDLPPCCQKKRVKDDCCSDEIEVVKTTLDQINPTSESIDLDLSTDVVTQSESMHFAFDFSLPTLSKKCFNYKRPPPLWRSGRQIQTFYQTWQI